MDNLQLTDHFSLFELIASSHRGIDNTPSDEMIAQLKKLAEFLENARLFVGPMHINSGYRCEELNKAVGGAANSQHVKGEAADFVPLNMTKKQAIQYILDSDLDFDQLISEFIEPPKDGHESLSGWIHLSMAPSGWHPRKSKLMINSTTNGYKLLDMDKI